MKVTLESTDKIVDLVIAGADSGAEKTVPARVWQGESADGIPVQAFITRIAPEIPLGDPNIDDLTAEFRRDLQRCATPRETIKAIPNRLIID